MKSNKEVAIYKSKDGSIELDIKLENKTLWFDAYHGKTRKMDISNLDMIISVGYRVNSKKATEFRKWATKILSITYYAEAALNLSCFI